MPIIFGWGRTISKNFGPVFQQLCSHCSNNKYWVLIRRQTWFSLFFIPVIPYETKWLFICPICQYGVTLELDQVAKFKPIAEINQLYSEGKITEQEYNRQIGALNNVPATESPAPQIEEASAKETIAAKEQSVYCGDCGNIIQHDGPFCTSCGTKINKD